MVRIGQKIPQNNANTSTSIEGHDLSMQIEVWKSKAKSDCRLVLMTKLLTLNLGFNELEAFNEALHLQIKSETLKRRILEGKQ